MKSYQLLGVRVDGVQIPEVIGRIEEWIHDGKTGRFIAVTGMHGVMEAQQDASFKAILNASDLVVSDGMPLVWVSRWYGLGLKRRVYGPELMETFFLQTRDRYTHFFYGSAPGVADKLARTFQDKFKARMVGTYCPPFRALSEEEEREFTQTVNAARPDVLWVGLSTPKQERWMYQHREKLAVAVMLGVGAAFDFHTGKVSQAPRWMREHGLEWVFRLTIEPRRLWRRYLVLGSKFTWNVALQLLKLKQFS
jgi:N-acetylglucosaminyldiphosphoundecaprenol N-acetyl-beta-D-mannosaminyltransferase